MLIVLEGVDGTGKTTLANNLMKFMPYMKYTHPVPSQGPEGQTREFMMDYMRWLFKEEEQGRSYITDRINCISEPIYGPICRGNSRLTEADIKECRNKLIALNPLIVYCLTSLEVIEREVQKEEQMEGVSDHLTFLYFAYTDFMIENYCDHLWVYDWTEDPTAEKFWEGAVKPHLKLKPVKKIFT